MASEIVRPAIASPHLFSAMIDRVDRILYQNNVHHNVDLGVRMANKVSPDPVIAPDAGQFFRVELLDHIEQCSEEGCDSDTRVAISSSDDATGSPYCNAHVYALFADWMVGV